MLAKRVDDIPAGDKWLFEPKWDGFRALVFRDGDEIEIQSRDTKSLNRYFPELVVSLARTASAGVACWTARLSLQVVMVLDFDALTACEYIRRPRG